MSGSARGGWSGALLAQPALLTVPLAFAMMIAGSPADPRPGAGRTSARAMVRLHAPEASSLDRGSYHPMTPEGG